MESKHAVLWGAVLVPLMVAGCGPSRSEVVAPKIDKAVTDAYVTGKEDPLRARVQLNLDVAEALTGYCNPDTCSGYPGEANVTTARRTLLETVLQRGKEAAGAPVEEAEYRQALITLFTDPAAAQYSDLQSAYAPELVLKADAAAGTSKDADVMTLAGVELATGAHVERDALHATGLFARAWSAGNTGAARLAEEEFELQGDLRSAYLWSLRRTNDAKAVQARQRLQKSVPQGDAGKIELASKDRSLITYRPEGA